MFSRSFLEVVSLFHVGAVLNYRFLGSVLFSLQGFRFYDIIVYQILSLLLGNGVILVLKKIMTLIFRYLVFY